MSSRWPSAFLASVLLGACAPQGGPPGLRRLTLADDAADPSERVPRAVATWDAAALAAAADASEDDGTRPSLTTRGGVRELELAQGGSITLRPGLAAGAFDRVVVELRAPGGGALTLAAFGSRRRGSAVARLDGRGVERVELPFPEAHAVGEPLQRLVLIARQGEGAVHLRSLTLLGSAPAAWLPPARAPELTALGDDARRAVGLAERPLTAALDPRPGERLQFAHGVPEELVPEDVEVAIELHLERTGGDPVVHRFPSPRGRWVQEQVSLPTNATAARFVLAADHAGAVAALTVPRLVRTGPRAPIAVLLTLDTHRADHVGAAGRGVVVATPALDALAARGTYFEDCLSGANSTNPSHVSLMTGLPVRDHRVLGNDLRLDEAAPTLAEAFAGAGWRTWAAVSVAHLGAEHSGLGQGFDRYGTPRGQRPAAQTVALLERWLEEEDELRLPTFVWLHVFDPHSPYEPEAACAARYWEGDAPLDPVGAPAVEGWRAPEWAPDVTDPAYLEALYRGEVTCQDGHLAHVFEHPALAGAHFAVVADHGEHMHNWLASFNHNGLAPATLDVPLVLAGPGVPAGQRATWPVSSPDVGRTLLDLAGLAGRPFPGRNLLAAEAAPELRFALGANATAAAVRRGPWLLVQDLYAPRPGRPIDHAVRLHDVERDPELRQNLAPEQHALACELRTELVHWLDAIGAEALAGERRGDAETLERLAALGYAASSNLPEEHPWIDPGCECGSCRRYPLVR